MPTQLEQDAIRNQVRESYAKVALEEADDSACGCAPAASTSFHRRKAIWRAE